MWLYRLPQPPQFKLDPRLARLLGIHTQTRSCIIQALWQYVKTNKLQDSHDKEYINCDKYFQQVWDSPCCKSRCTCINSVSITGKTGFIWKTWAIWKISVLQYWPLQFSKWYVLHFVFYNSTQRKISISGKPKQKKQMCCPTFQNKFSILCT